MVLTSRGVDDGRDHTPEKTEPGDRLADIVQECRSYHGRPSALRAKGNCHLFGGDKRVPPITAAHIKPEVSLCRKELVRGPRLVGGTRPLSMN